MAIQRLRLDIEMLDGTTYSGIEPTIADRMRFSRTRHRHKWPAMADDMDLAAIFLAWAALNRTGDFPGTFEEFERSAAAVAADDDLAEVDPTNPIPSADS